MDDSNENSIVVGDDDDDDDTGMGCGHVSNIGPILVDRLTETILKT